MDGSGTGIRSVSTSTSAVSVEHTYGYSLPQKWTCRPARTAEGIGPQGRCCGRCPPPGRAAKAGPSGQHTPRMCTTHVTRGQCMTSGTSFPTAHRREVGAVPADRNQGSSELATATANAKPRAPRAPRSTSCDPQGVPRSLLPVARKAEFAGLPLRQAVRAAIPREPVRGDAAVHELRRGW